MSEGKTLLEIFGGSRPSGDKGFVQSVALIANTKQGGIILACKPECELGWEIDQIGTVGLDDYGLDDAPHGLSIWEGYGRWSPGGYECPQDGQTDFEGKFRPLNAEEWGKLRAGEPLWPEPPEEPDVDEDQRAEV